MDKAANGLFIVLDLYAVAKDRDIRNDGLNKFVFLDGIHDIPNGAEVGEGIANLLLGEVTPVRVQFLRFRQNPEDDLRFGQHDVNILDNDLFKFVQRNTLQRTGGIDAFAVCFANKVTIGFVPGLLGVGGLHCTPAVSTTDNTLKRHDTSCAGRASFIGAVFLKKLLRTLPDLLRDDSLVFAGIEFIVVLDKSGANGVFEDTIDVCARKFAAAMLNPASFADADAFMYASLVQFSGSIPCRSKPEVRFEDSPHNFGFFRDDVELFGRQVGFISHRRDAACIHPLLF